MNKRQTGTIYEQRAAGYLRRHGYRILQCNYFCPLGEIDLVAKEGAYLVFVEVKYRSSSRMGEGQCAVDARKQRRISRAAQYYLMEHHAWEGIPCRFDVVAVNGQEITLIRDAFAASGAG